jgi:hypothetical protein
MSFLLREVRRAARRVSGKQLSSSLTRSETTRFDYEGVDRLLPPANYRVVTDEELIEGLSL